jgi:3-hydroxymyristoyl/3-hydroxydecanoyl-(acyl carrier protein) dehydratase
LLRGAGATPDRFHGVAAPDATIVEHVPGESVRANLDVPVSAPFFADHFPRRPVFPATLLLNAQIALAARIAREANMAQDAYDPVPVRMTHVKMRAFIVPGQQVDVGAEFAGIQDAATRVSLSARDGNGKTIATARVEFAAQAT